MIAYLATAGCEVLALIYVLIIMYDILQPSMGGCIWTDADGGALFSAGSSGARHPAQWRAAGAAHARVKKAGRQPFGPVVHACGTFLATTPCAQTFFVLYAIPAARARNAWYMLLCGARAPRKMAAWALAHVSTHTACAIRCLRLPRCAPAPGHGQSTPGALFSLSFCHGSRQFDDLRLNVYVQHRGRLIISLVASLVDRQSRRGGVRSTRAGSCRRKLMRVTKRASRRAMPDRAGQPVPLGQSCPLVGALPFVAA